LKSFQLFSLIISSSQINFLLFHFQVALPCRIDTCINIRVIHRTIEVVIMCDRYSAVVLRYFQLKSVVLSWGLRG
jgi:hypothetical protein